MSIHKNGFTVIEILLVVLVIALLGFAGWTWWQTRRNGTESATSQQVEKTNEATEESNTSTEMERSESAAPKSHPSFATGQMLLQDNNDAHITVPVNNSMRDQPLEAVWVEYGQDKTKLNNTSKKNSSHLAYNTMGNYGGFTIVIPASKLESNSMYFYRAAGETKDGEKIYGGIAGFTHK